MPRAILTTSVVLAAFSFSGCAEQKAYKYRIAVIPKGLTHEFWQSIHRGAERAASDLERQGIPVQIIWDGPRKENDAIAQIRIVDRRISYGVDGIVLAPQHSETMVAPVKRAVEQGIPVAIIDSGLDPEARRQKLFVKYVATNNRNGGKLAALRLLKVLEEQGKLTPKIVLFRYQVGSESTEERERGFEDEVNRAIADPTRKIKPVWLSKDKYAGATTDSALKEALPLVTRFRDEIDGIFAVNESAAAGMLNALRGVGLEKKITLVGFDSSETLLQAVHAGEVDALIVQDPYKMGYMGVWMLVQHLEGYDVDLATDYGTDEHVVTELNLNHPETMELFRPDLQSRRTIKTDLRFARRPSR